MEDEARGDNERQSDAELVTCSVNQVFVCC